MAFQNPTEEFVFNLCRGSFLSLWSYANPRREGSSKELCDILVVCEPNVIIFSVKHSAYQETDDPEIGARRWLRETVEYSVKGIYGAERNLSRATHVTRSDGQHGLPLPPLADRKVHRISVSLGGRRLVALPSKDFGKGFVHCFDDQVTQIALKELDTIGDFIAYLEAKEHLYRHERVEMLGQEEDLLAIYLHSGRKFPQADVLLVNRDLWSSFLKNPAYQRRVEADYVSYAWDDLIEYVAKYVLEGRMELGGTLSDNERALRVMAQESRFARRVLADSFVEFRERARRGEASARMMQSPLRITYVFYSPPASHEREERKQVLVLRCLVARNKFEENKTVVGIGLNVEPGPMGYAVDLALVHFPEWTDDLRKRVEETQQELGYFRTLEEFSNHVDEYPEA